MPALNQEPFEVMFGPCEVWTAVADSPPPELGAVVGTPWERIGMNGADNMPEDGLSLSFSSDMSTWTPITRALPTKVKRMAQEAHITFSLADVSLETLQWAFDSDGDLLTIVPPAGSTPGPAKVGWKELPIEMAVNPLYVAMTVRFDQSPYGLGVAPTPIWRQQMYFPAVYNASSPELVFQKGNQPAMVAFDFMPVSSAEFTREPLFMAVHASALP
jgi:hypothetical protein